MFLDRPSWLFVVGGSAVFIAVVQAIALRSRPGRPLTGLEFFGALGASLFMSSAIAVVLLMLYGAVRGLFALIGLTGIPLPWGGTTAARTTVAVFGSVLLLGAAGATGELLANRLVPRTGIGNAPLFPGLTWRRVALAGAPLLAGVAALVVLAVRGWWLAWIPVLIAMLAAGVPLHTTLERQDVPRRKHRTMQAVRRLLEAAGYLVIDRLQTGDPDLDRTISVYDLLAQSDSHALALQFKTDDRVNTPVLWSEAVSLRTAVRPLYTAMKRAGFGVRTATPVLVLSGRAAGEDLVGLAREESIRIIELSDTATVDLILNERTPPDELRRLSQSVLGLVSTVMAGPQQGSAT
jgi:hypothetical protein